MRLKNKGFTLVELLAAVSLLAILSGLAIISVTRYQEKARQTSYEAMESSAFSAAQNYIQKTGAIIEVDNPREISINELVNQGYLPNLQDPKTKSTYCHDGSKVIITKEKGSGSILDKYTYLVIIKCKEYESSHYETDADGNKEKKQGVYYYS